MKPGKINHIHFVGIGGIGMSGIAELLHNLGFHVSGSDLQTNYLTQRLSELGVTTTVGHDANNIQNADVLVISTAIADDNPEILAAQQRHIPVIPRGQMLAELMSLKKGIAIAGAHGKTTTTSLLASIFNAAKLDPTYVIGGKLNSVGRNAYLGKGEYFIAESDESDASFLHIHPLMAIVTNIDNEHIVAYQNDADQLKAAFVEFLQSIPFYGLAVLCIDDPHIAEILPQITCPMLTYGTARNADIWLHDFKQQGTQSTFKVSSLCLNLSNFECALNMPGEHNALNAIAAMAIALHCDIKLDTIQHALQAFTGVGRRSQHCGIGTFGGKTVTLIDDYGHHPKEIAVTLKAIRQAWPNQRIVHIFQPHRYTRTRDLFTDFVKTLSSGDALILLDVHPASEKPIENADSQALCKAIQEQYSLDPIVVSDFAAIPDILATVVQENDIVLTQGAGSISRLMPDYLQT